jgi:Holliday junction resolvasome RuvABC ATP-dependent DNA helicase subunit
MIYNFNVLPNEEDRRRLVDRRINIWSPFNRIVGNDNAVDALTDLCYQALSNNQHEVAARLMLVGPPSAGKTALALATADVLGIVRVIVDGTQMKTNEQLAQLILEEWAKQRCVLPSQDYGGTELYLLPSTLIFVDEIHRLPEATQEGLLKATEASDGMLFGKSVVVNCKRVFWIGATTKPGKLEKAFKTRWRRIVVEAPTAEQCAIILQRRTGWELPLCRQVVHYAGRVPREVLAFSEALEAGAARMGVSLAMALPEVAKREGIDKWGMRIQRVKVLQALKGQADGALLRQIVYATSLDAEELTGDWIPPMLADGLITHDSRYYLTAAGSAELVKRGL